MKKALQLLTISGLILSTVGFTSCKRFRSIKGSGKSATERRTVVNFDHIDISGGFDVVIRQDSSSVVTVTADDNLLPHIKTDVEGSTLHIHSDRGLNSVSKMTITVGFKHLRKLEASGGVEVSGEGHINTGDLDLGLSGATKVTLDVTAARVHTEGSGSTEVNLKGQATSHEVDLTGSGTLEALDFVVGKYDIETTGAGHCRINVLNELNVHSTGSSEVEYRGNPSQVSEHKTGSSSLTKIN